MADDLAVRGWTAGDLAARANVAVSTVTRFLRGEFQTPKTAKRLAVALGFRTAKRYLIARQDAAGAEVLHRE